MKSNLIETGQIVNTHGTRGEVRVQPWADSPEELTSIGSFYIDDVPIKVLSAKVHKSNLIVHFEGIDSIDSAIKLKNKVISAKREDIKLEEGSYFISDLIGLTAIDADTGDTVGEVADILTLPANNVYVIQGERVILIPAVPEFIAETNLEQGFIKFRIIEGL